VKKVMFDIGHGGTDPGAVANGLIEKDVNLAVGLKVRKYLTGYDAEIKLTRETDITLDANARVKMVVQYNPTLCVSIHHNKANGTARGSEAIHAAKNKKDDLLAADILNRLEKAGMPVRRAFTKLNDNGQDWYYMIRRIADWDTDAIIVEGGFLDNIDDAKLLKTDSFLDAEAKAIADSIIAYLKLKRIEEAPKEVQHWGVPLIQKLKENGLITTIHNPEDKLTWAEFASVIVKLFDN